EIPLAVVKKQPSDKLRYYEEAEKDSAKLAEQRRNDPYLNSFERSPEYGAGEPGANENSLNTSVYPDGYEEAPETKVLEKLEQLSAALQEGEGLDTAAQATTSSL